MQKSTLASTQITLATVKQSKTTLNPSEAIYCGSYICTFRLFTSPDRFLYIHDYNNFFIIGAFRVFFFMTVAHTTACNCSIKVILIISHVIFFLGLSLSCKAAISSFCSFLCIFWINLSVYHPINRFNPVCPDFVFMG